MAEENDVVEPISMANTKKEMLEAYKKLLKLHKEKSQARVQPEKKLEEKKKREVLELAGALSTEGIARDVANLKLEIGKILTELADRMESEVQKLGAVQKAINVKEGELQEIYEIDKAAETLAALVEAQHEKREAFEAEIAARKSKLEEEILTRRAAWEEEKKAHEDRTKEQEEVEKKRRARDKEEYDYTFKRERQLAKDKFDDEKAKQERDAVLKREAWEKDLNQRAAALAEKEDELKRLREQAAGSAKATDEAVAKAVKDTEARLRLEAKNREDLARKEFDGERNVLTARIESLEGRVKELAGQAGTLSKQLELAYQKVQDIAVKAIEGASTTQSLANLQQWFADQMGRKEKEK